MVAENGYLCIPLLLRRGWHDRTGTGTVALCAISPEFS